MMKTMRLPMWLSFSVAVFALSAPLAASAQHDAPPSEADANAELGAETQAWVDLQISNNASLGAARPMSGEVADQVFARYLKSFTHPIPEYFERDKFVQSGGSQ
jgi:hypothetical protein